MNKHLVLLLLGFSFAGSASAQLSALDAQSKAFEACGDTREVGTRGAFQITTTILGWTGGCVGGKRNGHGVLMFRSETIYPKYNYTNVSQQEGQFVKGRQLGLWCSSRHQAFVNINIVKNENAQADYTSCTVLYGNYASNTPFRKLPDGRWQLIARGLPAVPLTFAVAGALEAESARVLADVKAGKTDLKSALVVQSPVLDDLVRGSKIVLAPIPGALSLKDNRVAIVLSSSMNQEIERFKRERQVLIAATSGLTGEAAATRAKFIAASNPERLLTNIANVLRRHTREVRSFDDSLGELGKAGFDYALVVDWKYITRLDLLGKYDAFPSGTSADIHSGKVPAFRGESLSAFLIAPDLKIVRQYAGAMGMVSKHGTAIGDGGYLTDLYDGIENAWGKSPMLADGSTVFYLENQLRLDNEQ